MGKIKYVAGDISIEMDDKIERMVGSALEDKSPLIEGLQAELDRINADIIAEWPVDSGESFDAFRLFIGVGDGVITARVTNRADYFYFVKGKGHNGRQSWREVITKPMRRRLKELVRSLEHDWAEVLRNV